MSEVTYKRELNHSYMVIGCEACNISESYAYRMMTRNHIGRLLQCSQRQMDGESFLYYDISSRQPLERLYEARKLDAEDMKRIIYAIAAIQADLGEYLLDGQGLMLEAGMIFADVETEELYFCFNPENQDARQRYAKLADFFLGHVDHSEEHAVNIAYQFYKMSKAEYFVLSAFLPFLEKEMSAWRAQSGGLWQAQSGGLRDEVREIPTGTADRETRKGIEDGRERDGTERCIWEDLQEPQDEPEREKKGWLSRIFGKKRKLPAKRQQRKPKWKRTKAESASEPEKEREDWSASVWDSYAGQEALMQTGETVYFSDLDGIKKRPEGIPCLTEEAGVRQLRLENLPLTVGKLKGKVAIVLEDSSVSRMHARLECGESGICVRDLNSRNGTLVNGRKLSPNEAAELSLGDLVQFGRERFRYEFIPLDAGSPLGVGRAFGAGSPLDGGRAMNGGGTSGIGSPLGVGRALESGRASGGRL